MSWKNNLPSYLCILVCILALLIASFLFYSQSNKILGVNVSEGQESHLKKTLTYSETSPDSTQRITRYKFNNYPGLFADYKDYLNNSILIVLKGLVEGEETYVFIGEERTDDPHWLGNSHIFFTSYCGTACKGIYLVNILDKESNLGVLSYMYSDQNNSQETHFKDWFGNKFELAGWVKNIRSVSLNEKAYLIFDMWDSGQHLGEKKFLFTGNSLKEQ